MVSSAASAVSGLLSFVSAASLAPLETLAGGARWPETLAGTDFARISLELDGSLRKHGARTLTLSTLGPSRAPLLAHGRMPSTAMASFVLASERIARAVVTHVRVPPFFAALAVVIHPRPEWEAPLLVADMTITPMGRARALVDACGPAIGARGFAERFGAPLAQVVDSATGVRRTTVPAWLAPVSGAGGGTLRAGRGSAEGLARIVLRYVDRYLVALDGAPRVTEAAAVRANGEAARAVRDRVRANGPAKGHLARAFGEDIAERSLRLLWQDE
jgi:hypothetical protein